MSEIILPALMGVLLVATVVASSGYYKRLSQAKKEYEIAKDAVEDIVLSFNRELKRESERLEQIAFKVEGSLAKSETGLRRMDNIEKRFSQVENQLSNLEDQRSTIENQKNYFENQISQLNSLTQNNTNLSNTLSGLDGKIKDVEATQELLKAKITGFEEQIQKIAFNSSESKVEQSMPVVPIKRDKALASLTNTEVAVLEMLSSEGSKTAPEIKERVGLSREHTARLMKKLYEEGYLEREMGKIPFRYSVKKEMEKFLKKEEQSTPSI